MIVDLIEVEPGVYVFPEDIEIQYISMDYGAAEEKVLEECTDEVSTHMWDAFLYAMQHHFKILLFVLFAVNGFSQTKIVGFVNDGYITSLDSSYIQISKCTYDNLGPIINQSFETDLLYGVIIKELYYLLSEDLKYGVLMNIPKEIVCTTFVHYDNIPLKIKYKP